MMKCSHYYQSHTHQKKRYCCCYYYCDFVFSIFFLLSFGCGANEMPSRYPHGPVLVVVLWNHLYHARQDYEYCHYGCVAKKMCLCCHLVVAVAAVVVVDKKYSYRVNNYLKTQEVRTAHPVVGCDLANMSTLG